MPRLPQPGADEGQWGQILNDYLSQVHNTDGTLKSNIVTSTHLAPNAVTETVLGATGGTDGQILTKDSSVAAGMSWKPVPVSGGAVTDATTTNKGAVQLAGDLAGTAAAPTVPALAGKIDSSKIGAANGVAGLDSTGKVPASQLPVASVDDILIPITTNTTPAAGTVLWMLRGWINTGTVTVTVGDVSLPAGQAVVLAWDGTKWVQPTLATLSGGGTTSTTTTLPATTTTTTTVGTTTTTTTLPGTTTTTTTVPATTTTTTTVPATTTTTTTAATTTTTTTAATGFSAFDLNITGSNLSKVTATNLTATSMTAYLSKDGISSFLTQVMSGSSGSWTTTIGGANWGGLFEGGFARAYAWAVDNTATKSTVVSKMYRVAAAGWQEITQAQIDADVTKPVISAVTLSSTSFTISASDDVALAVQPNRYSKDGGNTWTAWAATLGGGWSGGAPTVGSSVIFQVRDVRGNISDNFSVVYNG